MRNKNLSITISFNLDYCQSFLDLMIAFRICIRHLHRFCNFRNLLIICILLLASVFKKKSICGFIHIIFKNFLPTLWKIRSLVAWKEGMCDIQRNTLNTLELNRLKEYQYKLYYNAINTIDTAQLAEQCCNCRLR